MQCKRQGCKANAMTGDDFCFWHSPETAEKRKEAGRRGGSRKKLQRSSQIDSMDDVKRILAQTINEVRSSPTTNTISKGRAIGYLLGIMITALEKSDIEQRISRLEELLIKDTG